MKKSITTSVQINADSQTVWKVFTDFKSYPEWNPFVKSLKGEVKVGNQIEVKLQNMIFRPRVLKFDKSEEFIWLGHLWFKGLFDGEHSFRLTDNGDGTTTFEQRESFSGLLVRMLAKKLDKDTKPGFEAMNKELKLRVEKYHAPL